MRGVCGVRWPTRRSPLKGRQHTRGARISFRLNCTASPVIRITSRMLWARRRHRGRCR